VAAFERAHHHADTIPYLATLMILLGVGCYYAPRIQVIEKAHTFFGNRVNQLYNRFLVYPYKLLSVSLWKVGDLELIQKQWVEGSAFRIYGCGKKVALAQDGKLYNYAFTMLAGLTLAIMWLYFQL